MVRCNTGEIVEYLFLWQFNWLWRRHAQGLWGMCGGSFKWNIPGEPQGKSRVNFFKNWKRFVWIHVFSRQPKCCTVTARRQTSDDNMKNGSSKCPAISPMCDRQSDYNQINLLVAFIQAHSRTQPPPRPDQHPALTVWTEEAHLPCLRCVKATWTKVWPDVSTGMSSSFR